MAQRATAETESDSFSFSPASGSTRARARMEFALGTVRPRGLPGLATLHDAPAAHPSKGRVYYLL